MTKLHEATELGQSIWLDYLRRAFIESGELQSLIDDGLRGITSNPSIFEKAIAGSSDYDDDISELVAAGKSDEEIYEALVVEDIQNAADLLRPIYEETNGDDGYVSLEASPYLAYDTEATLDEVRHLHAAVDRPNVMFKVPATAAGIPAIATLIGEGININVTFMFSLRDYDAVADAYMRGLERLAASGGDLSQVASVASFFVSRVDTAVDNKLDELGDETLRGKIGIANAKMAYTRYLNTFASQRWQQLAAQGGRVQRVLYGSTSVKDPAYPDTMYVDNLMGANTVNTLPQSTIDAFRDHGTVSSGLTRDLDEARDYLVQLNRLGIDLEVITQQLQDEGVTKFADAFTGLMESITRKRQHLQENHEAMSVTLGQYQGEVDEALQEMEEDDVIRRIWSRDYTVWKPDPSEISNRLGWLHIADVMSDNLHRMTALADEVRDDGYSDVLLLGMGGSSLAPEMFGQVFGDGRDSLDLSVLDSTDPDAVSAYAERLDPSRTLFIVSSKSGTTVETLSFFKYFYNRVLDTVGADEAGRHFVAVTDPGSNLVQLAQEHNFRAVFENDPNIGGRYSALSYFGLVPAALVGVDLERLLQRAQAVAANAGSLDPAANGDNPSARLGAILGELARAGRDKVTLITSPAIASFGDWVEQLIAESTGKDGKGILPVVGEPVGDPDVYGPDRLFVYLHLEGDDGHEAAVQALAEAGHPVVRLHLQDLYDLGGQLFLWEMATAVAGYRIDIHPFNQPNVEAAKKLARQMVDAYREKGKLPEGETAPLTADSLHAFLAQAEPGDYIALQAFVRPTDETTEALQSLRAALRDRHKLATTVGYGPRFLHSTGQLHKGDGGDGLFIQFTSEAEVDVPIPNEAGSAESDISFGVLKMAQALGDAQALREEGRRLIRFHLDRKVAAGLQRLAEAAK